MTGLFRGKPRKIKALRPSREG